MSLTATVWVWSNADAKGDELVTLLAMSESCDDSGQVRCRLASLCGYNRLTEIETVAVLTQLEKRGVIEFSSDEWAAQNDYDLSAVIVGLAKEFALRPVRQKTARELVAEQWGRMRRTVTPVIFNRDGHKCVYCGSVENLTIDHKLAISNGGSNDVGNLATCCRYCNTSKGDRFLDNWLATRKGKV